MDIKIKRRLIISIISIITIIFALSILAYIWQHGRLQVALPSEAQSIQVLNSNNEAIVDSVISDETSYATILPSGWYEVAVTSENASKMTSYFVEVPGFFGVTQREVTLYNQAEREKIGRGALACPVLSGDQLYSYNCAGSSSLDRTASQSVETSIQTSSINIPSIIDAKSYKNGAIVISTETLLDAEITKPILSFVRDGRVVERIDLPEALTSPLDGRGDYQLIINEINTNEFLITLDNHSTIYKFDNFGSDGEAINLSEPLSYTDRPVISSLRFVEDSIYTVIGSANPDEEDGFSPGDDAIVASNHVDIKHYTIAGSEAQLNNAVDIENLIIEEASLCAIDYACLILPDGLELRRLEEPEKRFAFIPNATAPLIPVAQDSFLYMKDDRLFLFDTSKLEARMIYHSDNFSLSSITPSSNDETLLNAFIKSDSTTPSLNAFTFLIRSKEPSQSNRFIDDTLPYPQGAIDGAVLASDFYKNEVVVKLQLDSWESPVRASGGGASGYTYNQDEFNEKRDRVLQQLREDGITSDDYRIRIIP